MSVARWIAFTAATALIVGRGQLLVPALSRTGQTSPRSRELQQSQRLAGLQAADLARLKAVGDVHVSPDGARVAYTIISQDRPGRPYSQVWILNLSTQQSTQLGSPDSTASNPRWSPNGRSIAYVASNGRKAELMIADAVGGHSRSIAPVSDTNHPLPSAGNPIAWSPDATRIAFTSSTPGPEQDANGDPMVITRYLYKPTASEGLTRFNDNRRLHIFVADIGSDAVRQLTSGNDYEHSIDWCPCGDRILFVSNREPDPDRVFNYDVFTVKVADGSIERLTETKNAEYDPVWSPDGRQIAYLATTRPLTSSETTMEDTHVWLMNADGSDRRERVRLDNRQGAPQWSPDGQWIYFTVQERGSNHLYRTPLVKQAVRVSDDKTLVTEPGEGQAVVKEPGIVGGWSIARSERSSDPLLAYAFSSASGPSELMLRRERSSISATAENPVALTSLNADLLGNRQLAKPESFTFNSFDGTQIEAFLVPPLDVRLKPDTTGNDSSSASVPPDSVVSGFSRTSPTKHPIIVIMHGGPHGQQGPAFNFKSQVYAAHGWASLMVNFRGSTGYGQKLADAIFGDQNGSEAKDVLAGVDAALKRYQWLDTDRMGLEGVSYGGQLTNWIITQTNRFKAAIPISSISNLITQNYLSYYHDYLAVEFGGFPHERGISDKLWERSAIRYADKVNTPTMFVHGENDNDVPIAEAEQFYIALKDVGVETIMIRYPREGHGIRETGHTIDLTNRSIEWYEKHFAGK